MTELLSIIQVLKDLTPKKILVILLSGMILIAVWKFDMVVDSIIKLDTKFSDNQKETDPAKSRLIFDETSDNGISLENRQIIKSYVSEYLSRFPKSTYSISVFKFLPPGEHYAYQGRALVVFKSRDMDISQEEKFLKEINIYWMPIWSGKRSMETILEGNPIALVYSEDKNIFIDTNSNQDVTPSSNFPILHEIGIKSIYRYPISLNDRIIGYVSIYFDEKLNKETEREISKLSGFLNSRIAGYLK